MTTDRIHKPGEYAQAGIAWYWLVDPGRPSVSVYRLPSGEGGYLLCAEHTEHLRVTEPVGLHIPAADLVRR